MQFLKDANIQVINQLKSGLQQIPNEAYSKPLAVFSGSSLGMHSRHIVEFYTCFLDNLESEICYDNRKRELIYEIDVNSTIEQLTMIEQQIDQIEINQKITLQSAPNPGALDVESTIESCYKRELLYLLDHTIHHMALLKIGFNMYFQHVKLDKNFGVAPSTIIYHEQCAR